MSTRNPTPIQVGMTGAFLGKRYRVAGRVVMRTDAEGEMYFWQEFHLIGDGGTEATLVFEEGEGGPEWRVFTQFEPATPLSATAATTIREGATVNLDGRPARVTLVGVSRVHSIEGVAPEGVEAGDVANYFNAKSGAAMLVASWTGEEIEFFRGVDVQEGAVASAFNLRREQLALGRPQPVRSSLSLFFGKSFSPASSFVLIVILLVCILVAPSAYRSMLNRPTITKKSAPSAPLKIGGEGTLAGRKYRVRGHAVMEIARVNLIFERHEFSLADEQGNPALLLCGLKPGDAQWQLLHPFQPPEPVTPERAAALRVGESVRFEGASAFGVVGDIFRSTVRQSADGQAAVPAPGAVSYGFSGASADALLFARWSEREIQFYRGRTIEAKETAAAFASEK